jgi:hypothetical protein
MRRLLIAVLAAAVLGAGVSAAAGSARVQRSPLLLVVNTNDRFTIAGTHIACRVIRRSARVTNRLVCFEQTNALIFRARRGTYEVELSAAGVGVSRVGGTRAVFARTEVAPAGEPSGIALATALLGGSGRLTGRQDRVFVAGTNIVCRPFGTAPKESLLCVLLGRDGHVHDGTYLVFISDHGVLVARSQNRRAVTVFERVHGR